MSNDPSQATSTSSAEKKSGNVLNESLIQRGLIIVSVVCVVAGIGHIFWPTIDEKTAMFLGLAAVVLIIRDISKLEFPGVKLERFRREVQEDIKQVEKQVNILQKSTDLPGRPARLGVATSKSLNIDSSKDDWDTDPNKNKFGGSPDENGRRLEAQISPAVGPKNPACNVRVRVFSTDPDRPLTGKVTFFMHPTFGRYREYSIPVKKGVAEDEFMSWGVFTIGAVADEGKTKLELDLNDVPGGTKKFYEQ